MDKMQGMDKEMGQMNDLGVESRYSETVPSSGEGKKSVHYPSESFTTDQMPGLEGAKVGQKVQMMMEGEVVEVSRGDMYSEEDGDAPKTRVAVKFRKGACKMMEDMPMDKRTEKQKSEDQVNDFSKTIGVDEEEE